MPTTEQAKFVVLTDVLLKLESITNGEIPKNWFSLNPHNLKKIDEYQSKKLFKKYIIEFCDNGFRITAKTLESNLDVSILYFEKLKKLFDQSKQIDSAISISDGDFVIIYPREE